MGSQRKEVYLLVESSVEDVLTKLLDAEKSNTCGSEPRQAYRDIHQARFADILRICRKQVPNHSARVLDIGRSELTSYLLNFYGDIHTLGLDPSIDDGGHREVSKMEAVPHIPFDLLNSQIPSSWPDCGRFDLIVFSEVIEHLGVAPEYVFACLASLLADRGVLICTTPNAADISKRMRLALGQNPYERLRLYSVNPGHVREYTKRELCEIAGKVGLVCLSHSYLNWIQDKRGNPIKAAIMRFLRLYPRYRSFQVCVLARESNPI
jgi:hypothetical protein